MLAWANNKASGVTQLLLFTIPNHLFLLNKILVMNDNRMIQLILLSDKTVDVEQILNKSEKPNLKINRDKGRRRTREH